MSRVEADGRSVRLQVRGSVEPLLRVLATTRVKELLSREPSLEELFLSPLRCGPGPGSERACRLSPYCRPI